jgi:hypothetical protein
MGEIFKKTTECVIKQAGNEFILVPLTDNIAQMNSMYTLNETGAFIWERIDGKNSLESIAQMISDEFETDYESALKDTKAFIEKLNDLVSEIAL